VFHNFPCQLQEEKKDCAIAALSMIIMYHKGYIPMNELKDLINTTNEGTSMYNILIAAKKIGLDSKGIKGIFTNLTKDMLPCIAHVIINEKYYHFIVIYEINFLKKRLIVADPAIGIKYLSFDEFSKITTNHYLIFKPQKLLPFNKEENPIPKIILSIFKEEWHLLIFLFILSFFITLTGLLISMFLKILLQWGNGFRNILSLGICYFLITILYECSLYIKNKLSFKLIQKIDFILMSKVYEQIILLPFLYYKNKTTGEQIFRLQDASFFSQFILKGLNFLLFDLPLFITSFIILAVLSNILLAMTILIVCISLMLFLIFKKTKEEEIKIQKVDSSMFSSLITEDLTYLSTIKNLHLEEEKIIEFQDQYNNCLNSQSNLFLLSQKQLSLLNILRSNLKIFILCFGSSLVLKNKLAIENLILIDSIYFYFFNSLNNFLNLLFDFTTFKVIYKRLGNFFETKKENFSYNYKYQQIPIKGSIIVKNLSFSYNDIDKCLDNISLKINAKEKVLWCGFSGSGKSTLASLILRHYKVGANQLFLDNRDINLYHLENIRDHITYVSQKEGLFSKTIYQNITLDENVSYSEFLKVCKLVKVDEIVKKNISLYDMLLEENGANLSGGERQRIILARSLLRKSDIYIFDESLNELDVNLERIILKNIFSYLKDKTVIVISHRFHNQYLFDRKIKFSDGRIVYDEISKNRKFPSIKV